MRATALYLGLLLSLPVGASAQAPNCYVRGNVQDLATRLSPLDSVSIPLGDGVAKLCYGRPSKRGRVMVGGQDPFGRPWRMGANEPTTLHLPFPATVGGVSLKAGAYRLYAVPTDSTWTLVVNGNVDKKSWGIPIDAKVRAGDIGHFEVTPKHLARSVETLTFTFDRTSDRSGALVYAWENRTFRIPIIRP
jgi:hypothetical protein